MERKIVIKDEHAVPVELTQKQWVAVKEALGFVLTCVSNRYINFADQDGMDHHKWNIAFQKIQEKLDWLAVMEKNDKS